MSPESALNIIHASPDWTTLSRNVERVSVSVYLKRLEDARTRELNEISEGFIATK